MSSPNHLRFGEVAAENNMNYTADASFGNVRQGGTVLSTSVAYAPFIAGYEQALTGTSSPATFGRYLKEDGARFISPRMPDSLTRPLRVTWTEVSCDLWFDENNDGWLGDDPSVNASRNDRFGPGGVGVPDGKRDVRVDLELWDDRGPAGPVGDVNLLGPGARLTAPGASNRVPLPQGRLYYKAVFVNDWDATTRLNNPLDVTPFLDDVTVTYAPAGGCKVLCWEWDPAE